MRAATFAFLSTLMFPAFCSAQPADGIPPPAAISSALAQCFDAGRPCARVQPSGRRTADQSGSPDAPRDGSLSDGAGFRTLVGAFVTAAGTDLGVSMYQIGRGAARERGFGGWWQDSPVAFGLTKSGAIAFSVYALETMHKTNPKAAFVLGLVATSVEAALAARSASMKPTVP